MKKRTPKICFAASSGGHLEELLTLRPLMDAYDSFLVTEKTAYVETADSLRRYYLSQVNRQEISCFPRLAGNAARSLWILLKERPDMVISTGVLATVPLCLLCKLFRKKLVYIESYSRVSTPTRTGKLLYRFADRFYIQWPELKRCYPNAVYYGGVF